MTGLSLALALVQLLNFVVGLLDSSGKTKTAQALSEAENLKHDLAAVHDANLARAAVAVDDASLRVPNADSRP